RARISDRIERLSVRASVRLDEGDDGGDGRPVLLEEAMGPLCVAGVVAWLAGGVDPLDPGLAAGPGDEARRVSWRREPASILAVMDNQSCWQRARRAQSGHDARVDAGDEDHAA